MYDLGGVWLRFWGSLVSVLLNGGVIVVDILKMWGSSSPSPEP